MRAIFLGLIIALFLGRTIQAQPAAPPKRLSWIDVIAKAKPSDWRDIDQNNALYMKLPTGQVIIELAPEFAKNHVANIKALVLEHYYDGLSIIRVQDNYVVQWGDPNAEKPELARKVQNAKRTLPAEFDLNFTKDMPFTKLPDGDLYAPEAGFVNSFPVARDPATGKAWLIHTYGMVGAGRDESPDSGGGLELYVVIGQAPRHLDRNVTLVGRVIKGMELLSSLPRGTAAMGFYQKPEEMIPIKSVRIGSDVPPAEQLHLQALRTDTSLFQELIESRRNRAEPWYVRPAGRIEISNVPIPVQKKENKK